MQLTAEYIVERLQGQFGDRIREAYESYGMLTVIVDRDVNVEVLRFLKEDADFNFHFMTDLCGMHFPNQKDEELGVVYQLHNFIANVRIRIKSFFPISNPVIRTASELWPAANWMERETYDFFGIEFSGHPNLTRILNMDEMDYFPMRKQYPLEDATRTDKDDTQFGRGFMLDK